MKFQKPEINFIQIRALLLKDFLVRIRQPWMTALQFIWPCAIFVALYIFRHRFQPYDIDTCQFPTRQLPSTNQLVPFFQSYICTIENQCLNVSQYEELNGYEFAPATPVLNIVQMILAEKDIFDAITDLPKSKNIMGALITIGTHPKFGVIEKNIQTLIKSIPRFRKMIGSNFNIQKLFSDDRIFSSSGNILCGRPFPRSNMIRYVENILYTKDYNGPDADELAVMPTDYCKQLYIDVVSSNHGKITWNVVKPIIQGKIIYGPDTDEVREIMKFVNQTFVEMNHLKEFVGALDATVDLIQKDEEFQGKIDSLIDLLKSDFVAGIISSLNVDSSSIQSMLVGLKTDVQTKTIVQTLKNILECMSVDRFVGVNSEKELENLAFEMGNKKLFYAGIYFDIHDKNFSYKLRVDVDNTPMTLENRNRFYFPGPDGNFGLDMKYHRGFIEIQNAVDQGIIKRQKSKKNVVAKEAYDATTEKSAGAFVFNEDDDDDDDFGDFSDEQDLADEIEENSTDSVIDTDQDLNETTTSHPLIDLVFEELGGKINLSDIFPNGSDSIDFTEDEEADEPKNRTKRQLGFLSSLFGSKKKKEEPAFEIDKMQIFTRQFPYPKYTKDTFKKGLYLGQSVQMAFFFALLIQVASSVRQRIWLKESGNYTLMRIMGLQKSSEYLSWASTTFIELAIIFICAIIILYGGGILMYSSSFFIYCFLLIYGLCVISFCYMCSTFFESASIGSVSSVIMFLMTFMPYIVIIALGTYLAFGAKVLVNFSISTAFCYAWHFILRLEIQGKAATFADVFTGSFRENDLKLGVFMILLDTILYAVIGLLYERFRYDEFKFCKVPRRDLDPSIGALMKNVSKIYDDGVPAVNDVSIVFRKDFITCFLGRNGAGKSTIIKMLTGQIVPSYGEIYLTEGSSVDCGKERVGLCPQNNVFIPNLTTMEHLSLYSRIKLSRNFDEEVKKTMENLNFGKHENFMISELSGGFKRRLNIALAFIGGPSLVILDEPCSGVDSKARRMIWDLISLLKRGRAVVLATHHLDEAEHLSDSVLIMTDGKVAAESNCDSLREQFTKSFDLRMYLCEKDRLNAVEEIKVMLEHHFQNSCNIVDISNELFHIKIPYFKEQNVYKDLKPLFTDLDKLYDQKKLLNYTVKSRNLQEIFNKLNDKEMSKNKTIVNGLELNEAATNGKQSKEEFKKKMYEEQLESSTLAKIRCLLWKRFIHYRRNYRMLICILLLPVMFEIIAMGFMKLRPPGEYDKVLKFSRDLYEGAQEFYSYENGSEFLMEAFTESKTHCRQQCTKFDSSQKAFNWILDTHDKYIYRRYGGIIFNDTKAGVFYNNKGYHSMPTYLNVLNNGLFKSEMDDQGFSITTTNHPISAGVGDLTTSSILQQVSDAGISLILLLAFSLVIAACSVYIVNERVSGEKLQQKLSGINFHIYWGVAFLWDFVVYCIAILLAVIVFKAFAIPNFVAKDNLDGICMLLFLYGFASIPMVHLFEKMFSEASFANMSIFCLNIIIALTTVTIIIMFDILGETDETDRIRNALNRIFLILPQHAFADALVQICKNHIMSEIFKRYYIDTYKSPISSDLLQPHFTALFLLGLFFITLNYAIESGFIRKVVNRFLKRDKTGLELQNMKIDNFQNANGKQKNSNERHALSLRLENVTKSYGKDSNPLRGVSFDVKKRECYGLLGVNGAGKSTIFSILSGELQSDSGSIEFLDGAGVAYCPQTNALDDLLTVKEVIYFYGKLRCCQDLKNLTETTLNAFHLMPYKDVLVKNLSGGNRRKLSVAVTCSGSAKLILMDEPTSDMDPVTRGLVYSSVAQLTKDNRSVILSSHTIAEVDRVCDRIGILRDGKIVASGSPADLQQAYGNFYLVTIFYDHVEALSIERDVKRDFPAAKNVSVNNHSLQFMTRIRLGEHTTAQTDGIISEVEDLHFGELFEKLREFAQRSGSQFTVSECLLDQAVEAVMNESQAAPAYANVGFVENETSA